MSNEKDIRNSLRTIIKSNERTYSSLGIIQSVDEHTCDVKLINSDVIIFDVLLNIDSNTSVVEVPNVGSKCIITYLNHNTAYLAMTTTVESLSIITKDSDGNIVESLKEVLIDFVTEMYDNISVMTQTTAQGPTVSPPINNTSFLKTKDDFITRISKIFNK